MKNVFIYALCDKSGVRYIGKSINPQKRFKCHLYTSFKFGGKEYWYTRSIWIREHIDDVYQIILEVCGDDNWEEREVYWIGYYSGLVTLVNVAQGGKGTHGFKRSDEQCLRMSEAQKGKKHTEQAKKNMSDAKKGKEPIWLRGQTPWNKGKKMPVGVGVKISAKNKGREVWNKGISTQSPMAGKTHSLETRVKMSESAKRRWV